MGKGSGSTQTTTSSNQPPQAVLDAYSDAYSKAQAAANQPYQAYPGQTVAPLTSQQEAAIGLSPTSSANWNPYAAQAQNYLSAATQPLYNTVSQYESPYTNDVVNATQAQFNNNNAIQQQGVIGNAVSQGAWGGDRSAVAQGIVAGQQQMAQAPVIAGLENTGYQTALNANEAGDWLNSQAAGQTSALGQANFGVDQATLNQMMQFGQVGQQQQQAYLNAPYYQYQASQAYPFQTAGFLANVAEGLGSGAGGTSSTTSPGPSVASQIGGLGLGAAGIVGATGGFGSSGWLTNLFKQRGGAVPHYADGGGIAPPMGGSGMPFGAGVPFGIASPDLSASIVPQGQGGKPTGQFSAMGGNNGTTSTTTGGGGGAGGILGDLGAAASIGKFFLALQRGGAVPRYDTGGGITGALPYQQMAPQGGGMPNMGISIVPDVHVGHGGMGLPRAPGAAANPNLDLSPAGIMKMGQQTGAFGKNGWLNNMGFSPKGIDPPSPGPNARYGLAAPGGPMMGITDASATQYDPMMQSEYRRGGGIVGHYDDGGGVQYGDNLSDIVASLTPDTTNFSVPDPALADVPAAPAPSAATHQVSPNLYWDAGSGMLKKGTAPVVQGSDDAPVSSRNSFLENSGAVPAGSTAAVPDQGMGIAGTPMELAPVQVEGNASSSPRQRAIDAWTATGVAPHVAAGIADRIQAESSFNPQASGDNGTSYGLYQAHADRLQSLKDFAAARGTSPDDPDTNHAWAISQVNGGDPVATKHWAEIQAAPDEKTAAMLWDRYFERSANGPGAQATTEGYGPSAGGGIAPSPSAGGDDSSGSGMGIVPRATTPAASDNMAGINKPGVNPWLALAAAGFAMAGGRSPSALQNIGAGALEGVKMLETQRQSLPEIRLKNAQATQAEAIAGQYPALNKWSHEGALGQLDKNINTAHQGVANSGETQAQSVPGGAIAPLASGNDGGAAPGATPAASAANPAPITAASPPASTQSNLTPEQQRLVATLGQRRTYLDQQIQHWQNMPTGGIPANIENQAKMLQSLYTARTQVDQQDPQMAAQTAAMKVNAETPGLVQRAAGVAAAELPYKPFDARAGSIHGVGNTPLFAVPTPRTITDPLTGAKSEEYFTPPLPGQPQAGAPAAGNGAAPQAGGAVGASWPTGLSLPAEEQIKTEQEGFKSAKTNFIAAQNVQQRLGMMDHAIDQLNQSGWSSTGSGANMRLGAAKTINSVLTAVGGNPAFDPNKVASWEDLTKETTRAGFELARSLGSREAAMIVQSATAAVPNAENTAMGAKLVSSSLNQAAQREEDFYSFLNDWGTKNGGRLNGADIAFNQQNPPQKYVNQAILSAIPPAAVAALRNNPNLGPQFERKYSLPPAFALAH